MAISIKQSKEPDVMIEMNMTPLIDVMLVLIIMLIITIPIQNHVVNLSMPTHPASAQAEKPQVVNLDISADGTIAWNDKVLADRAALEVELREAAAMAEQPEIHLRPSKLVAYKVVAGVMATAQRLGVKKMGIVGNNS